MWEAFSTQKSDAIRLETSGRNPQTVDSLGKVRRR
jgi:hypothetical protein